MLGALRTGARATYLLVVLGGPPILLAAWWLRSLRLPGAVAFALTSTALCTASALSAFWAGEAILERQFRAIVGDDEWWTDADEARWSSQDRRIVGAYFGDGGRKVFATFIAPPVIAIYSVVSWLTGWTIAWLVRTCTRSGDRSAL